ncbi:MAG TPA: arylsulfatase [Lacipirellulaceae bacterium]|nr:arylsulfatase [Lacipirellulaceae bacterium]
MLRLVYLLTIAIVFPTTAVESAERPNIVLIYADDLGYGDVGCYGATAVRTPNIDQIANEGLRFTDAHSAAATCTPSRYAMLTGQYAWRRKGTGILPGDAPLIVEPGRTTLASMLQDAGYSTGVVGKWHLGLGVGRPDWNDEIKPGPLEIGFDYCFIIPATGDRVPCVYVENHQVAGLDPSDPIQVSYNRKVGDEPTGAERPDLLRMKLHHGHDQTIVNGISRIGYMTGGKAARWVDEDMADVITSKAIEFIQRHRDKPFFLYFATHDIHVPRVPHRRFQGASEMGPRGDAIAQLDWSVGQVTNALDALGLSENTLLILTSDNGPVLNDGYLDDAAERVGDHRPSGPLRGGKGSLFEGGTQVPFIVRWPARVQAGGSRALISQIDLIASLARLVGENLDEGTGPDSTDVLPALLGQTEVGRDSLVEQAAGLALRVGNWKYIGPRRGPAVNPNTRTETGASGVAQLYDLENDLAETRNLAMQHTERVEELSRLLDRIREAESSD